MNKFDILVIGSGPAGNTAAELAGDLGKKVALFEKNKLGGVCLNEGCIPTKCLLNSAKIFEQILDAKDYGIELAEGARLDHAAVLKRKDKVVKRLNMGIKASLRDKATVIDAEAKILPKEDGLFVVEASGEKYCGEKLIIATGSSAAMPPIKGIEEGLKDGFVITSREALELEDVPENLVIIGAGVIGLELAQYYNAAGSKVTVLERLERAVLSMEEETIDILRKSLSKKGVKFFFEANVLEIGDGEVVFEAKEEVQKVEADKVLVAAGRKGNIDNLGLENINIGTEKGYIICDNYLRTCDKDVFAIGDVNGKSLLAHAASRQASAAIRNLDENIDNITNHVIPSVIYTHPVAAGVGFTLERAKEAGINAKEIKLSLLYSGRYVAENIDLSGILKVVYDRDNATFVGAHMVGSYAGEIISTLTSYIDLKLKVEEIEKIVFPHPTVAEVIHDAAHMIIEKIKEYENKTE